MVASVLVLIFTETKQNSVKPFCNNLLGKNNNLFVTDIGAAIATVSSIRIPLYASLVSVLIILFIILAY